MTNLDTQWHDDRDGSRKNEDGSCDKNFAFFAVKPSQQLQKINRWNNVQQGSS